jgi:hypothetical protein
MASALAVEPIGSLRIVGLDLRRDHALAQPSKHAAFQSLAVYGAGVVADRCLAYGWCRHRNPDWERCAPPIRLCLLGEPKPGRRQAVKAEAAKPGARQRQPLRPEAGPVHCYQQQKEIPLGGLEGRQPLTSHYFIEPAFRTPCGGIGDPAVDVGLMPAAPVDADLDLSRECPLVDLAVDGRPGQPGSGNDGFESNDPIWFGHGKAASC